ncbi:hypothetical protein Tco_0836184 [Tanacetum coccineum]
MNSSDPSPSCRPTKVEVSKELPKSACRNKLQHTPLLASQSIALIDHKDLEQLDEFDLEEMDLKWQVAMISMRMKKFYKKTSRKLQFDLKEPVGVDWTSHSKKKKISLNALQQLSLDTEEVMHACTPTNEGNYMPSGPDIEIDYSKFTYGPKQTQPSESETQTSDIDTCESNISTEPPELVSEPVVNESNVESQPKVWFDAPIIEEYESDSEDEQAVLTSAAMKVNTVKPIVNRVNTAKVNAVSAVGGKGKLLLSPQQVVIGAHKDTTTSKMISHRALQNKGIVNMDVF